MAEVLGVPPNDFLSSWMSAGDIRDTNTFTTIEESIRYFLSLKSLNATDQAITAAKSLRLAWYIDHLRPRPGVIETLETLKNEGYKIALISNCSLPVPIIWPSHPISKFIDVPVFSCKVGLLKPNPSIFQLACQRINVIEKSCLYVADGAIGELEAAVGLGMSSVLIRTADDAEDGERISARSWKGPFIHNVAEVIEAVGLNE